MSIAGAVGEVKALSWIQITEGLLLHVKKVCLVPVGIGILSGDFKQRSCSIRFLFQEDDFAKQPEGCVRICEQNERGRPFKNSCNTQVTGDEVPKVLIGAIKVGSK